MQSSTPTLIERVGQQFSHDDDDDSGEAKWSYTPKATLWQQKSRATINSFIWPEDVSPKASNFFSQIWSSRSSSTHSQRKNNNNNHNMAETRATLWGVADASTVTSVGVFGSYLHQCTITTTTTSRTTCTSTQTRPTSPPFSSSSHPTSLSLSFLLVHSPLAVTNIRLWIEQQSVSDVTTQTTDMDHLDHQSI